VAYRQTYHSAVSDDLAARSLRDKCLQGDALQMVNHLDDLCEMWETLDTCYERPDKYMEEALRPIVDFRRYKITDSAAVRDFYSLLRAAIKGARRIGRVELLINDQTIPRIMGKMPHVDWKEWATKRPDWMRQGTTSAFEAFIERKWLDALNIAAAEPTPWRGDGERVVGGVRAPDRATGSGKGVLRLTGAVNVVERGDPPRSPSPLWDLSFGRKCRSRNLIGCNGDHVMLQCEKLMGEDSAGVNVIAGDESEDEDEAREEDEDEGWWVGTVSAMEMLDWAGEAPCNVPSVEQARDGDHGGAGDNSQVEYGHDPLPGECSAGKMAEDEWWELASDCPSLEEEEPGAARPEVMQHPLRAAARPTRSGSAGQQKLKKRPRADTDRNWEEARRSAWVRQLLSDDSSDEDGSEERYGRFAESGRWMSELYGFPQHLVPTSGGECSG
jgi:hypothetical protein